MDMRKFTFPRKHEEELDRVIEIYHWCVEQFEQYIDWSVSYTNNDNDDFVDFIFMNDAAATLFVLKWT